MKNIYAIPLLVIITQLLCHGCATTQQTWTCIEEKNTVSAYKEFVKQYPNSEFAKEAEKRITESDDDAFTRTCRLRTAQAFTGFVESYPTSDYAHTANARIEFLTAMKPGNLKSCKDFITSHPDNPFVAEAKASFPILWLKGRGKVGIVINVGQLAWKGLFYGGSGNKDSTRNRLSKELMGQLEKEGIQAVILEESGDSIPNDITTLLVLDYSEEENSYRSSAMGATQAFHQGSVDNLTKILVADYIKKTFITIKDAENETRYYSGTCSICSREPCQGHAGKDEAPYYTSTCSILLSVDRLSVIRALAGVKDNNVEACLAIALRDGDPNVRANAAWALKEITGKDFGEDPRKWQEWWQKNKGKPDNDK